MPRDGKIIEDEYNDDESGQPRRRHGYHNNSNNNHKVKWRVLEVVVRENAAVEVSILDLQVPRFSFRVGTAQFSEIEGEPVTVSPRLTIFNARDGIDLLTELEEKYSEIREKKIEELEARKRSAIKRMNPVPEVEVRRRTRQDDRS